MADKNQDVAQAWKGFDETRRKSLLAKMTPDQKKNLRSALEGTPAATDLTPTPGKGTYRMLPASQQGYTDTSQEKIVSYDKVKDALNSGLRLHPDEEKRYQDDSTHEGQGPTLIERATARIQNFFQPSKGMVGDIPILPGMDVNTGKAAARTVASIPSYLYSLGNAVKRVATGETDNANELLDLIDPTQMPKQMYDQFQADRQQYGDKIAAQNLTGTLEGLGIVSVVTHGAGKAIDAIKPAIGDTIAEHIRERVPAKPVKELVANTMKENVDRAAEHSKAILGDPDETPGSSKFLGALEETRQRELQYDQDEMAAQAKAKEKLDFENEAERQKVNKENLTKYEEQSAAEEKAAKERHDSVQKVAEIKAKNKLALETEKERQSVEGQYKAASASLASKYKAAFEKARNNYNATWKLWRDKVQNVMAPMSTVRDTINDQEKTLSPEQVSIFRDIMRETEPSSEDMTDFQRDRQSAMDNLGYKSSYDQLPPDRKIIIDDMMKRIGYTNISNAVNAVDVPASRLHTWKSQLEVAVRKAKGPLKHSIGKVLQSVRTLEDQVSTQAGAGKELHDARSISGPYYDAFFGSEQDLPQAARKSLREQVPEHVKETEAKARLERIAAYDPSITAAAKLIDDLAEKIDGITRLQRKLPHPSDLKPLPPKPSLTNPKTAELQKFEPKKTPNQELVERPERVPLPNRPETAQAGMEEAREVRAGSVHGMADWLRRRSQWIAMSAMIGGTMWESLHGRLSEAGEAVLLGATTYYSVAKVADFLEDNKVVKWLSEPPQRDIDELLKLPEEQRKGIISKFAPVVKAAQAKGVKVSPAIMAFLAGKSATQQDKKDPLSEVKTKGDELYNQFHKSGFAPAPKTGVTQ